MSRPSSFGHATKPATIWLILISLTLISIAIAERFDSAKLAIITVFLISALKADRVVVHYMEIKHAEASWQPLYRTWIIAVTVAIVTAHIA
jgi:Prokaryotic Cytochrome C oxidase subunit IV